MMMRPKAILLDLDDTIIAFDHGVDLDRCWTTVCHRHLPAYENRIEEICTLIRKQAKWFWSDPERHRVGRMDLDKARIDIVTVALHEGGIHEPQAAERIAVDYGMERDMAICLYPGSLDTLRALRDIGIRLALLTNGAGGPQRSKIERFALSPFFDLIVIEGEFGAGKPDKSVYRHALEQLGVSAEEAWMVGDNFEWEIVAPQELGIRGIWVNPQGKTPPAGVGAPPFRTIKSLPELISILNENEAHDCL